MLCERVGYCMREFVTVRTVWGDACDGMSLYQRVCYCMSGCVVVNTCNSTASGTMLISSSLSLPTPYSLS